MHLIDTDAAVNGQFTDGVSGVQEATICDDDWLNAVQNEAANLILMAGLTLNKSDHTQMRQAINILTDGPGIVLGRTWCPDAQNPTTNDTARDAIIFPAGSDAWVWTTFTPSRVDKDWRIKLDKALASAAANQSFDFRVAYLVVAAGAANPVVKTRRANSTYYAQGTYLVPIITSLNGYYYEVTVAGTTGASPPTYPTTPGNTVADGTATLTCRASGLNLLTHSFSPPGLAWQDFAVDSADLTIPHADLSAGCLVHLGLARRGSADSNTGALEINKARAYPVGA